MGRGVRTFLSASAIIAVGMMAGRIMGLVREMSLAGRFGLGDAADFVVLLLIIPDFITVALIGNAAGAVLIPAFTKSLPDARNRLLWQSMTAALLCSIITMLILGVAAWLLPSEQLQHRGYQRALWLAMLALPFSALTAIAGAYLQYARQLLAPACANLVFNIIIIAAIWMLSPSVTTVGFAIAVAAAVRLITHIIAISRAKVGSVGIYKDAWEINTQMGKAYVHATLASILSLLPMYVPYFLLGATDGLAAFNYAFKLVMLPTTLGQTIIAMILLPWLSKLFTQGGISSLAQNALKLRMMLWAIACAMTFALACASVPVVSLVFGYGSMERGDVLHVSQIFVQIIWVMPLMLLGSLWQQCYFAQSDTKTPFYGSAFQAATMIPLSIISFNIFGVTGLILSMIIAQLVLLTYFKITAQRSGFFTVSRPASYWLVMPLISTIIALPLYIYLQKQELADIWVIALYAGIGILSLLASIIIYPSLRHWLIQCITKK